MGLNMIGDEGDRSIKKNLIDFFSIYSVKEADSEAVETLLKLFGVNSRAELLRTDQYIQSYEPIERIRKELDSSIENLSCLDQVKSCLALLNTKKESNEKKVLEILIKLIGDDSKECLYKSWNKEQQDLYKKAFPIIVHWNDFFFSYTNRNLPETNHDFEELIIPAFDKAEYEREVNEINYVAKFIVRHLTQNNLQAFFDQDKIKCGDDIKHEILKHCKSCYTFVQLIEKQVFNCPDGEDNWCYLEFKDFDIGARDNSEDEKRHYFFLTHKAERVYPTIIHSDHVSWQNRIEEREYVAIIHESTNLELRKKIDGLAKEIKNTKDKILKPFLGDYI
jgi:hypothetical protein